MPMRNVRRAATLWGLRMLPNGSFGLHGRGLAHVWPNDAHGRWAFDEDSDFVGSQPAMGLGFRGCSKVWSAHNYVNVKTPVLVWALFRGFSWFLNVFGDCGGFCFCFCGFPNISIQKLFLLGGGALVEGWQKEADPWQPGVYS